MTARKIIAGAAVALTLGATMAATTSPAEARYGRRGAVVGGLAAGAILGGALAAGAYSRPYYGGYGYGYAPGYYGAYAAPVYGGCWRERRPVYDSWGNFRGYRLIRVCQ